ncbi:rhamnogalacturonan lyase family protein [Roseimarinus sediminis]|uniref:rhamnogalacturonan lyase family protein n=1 Tax=Roseimarinus sediminis TaxID=1610899 RepID=UPI003D195140
MNSKNLSILLSSALLALLFIFSINDGVAQRKMETLDRGLVAVKTDNGVFVSWRIPGSEWYGTTYNLYRDGEKLNELPLEVSNYTDTQGTLASSYTVRAIANGTEQSPSPAVTPLQKQYKEIILKTRNTSIYEINDATTADLDGDGAYEIIVKRIAKGWNEDNTNYSYFEAYKQDGTFLWEINVGPNILPDVEINIAAFDFDEDGKAEVFMRSSEGTIFGDGTQIGDTDNDGRTNYRYSVGTTANMQYMNAGPEFLSLIDGETGSELDRVNFIPRISSGWWWPENPNKAYGHRASKYFFGAPYLDGQKPSLFIGRGIYTRTVMRTYDVVNKKLQLRWEWKATDTSDPYYGQGNHNYTIADVDGDGRDEIVWGSMTVDDDGKGLYSTRMGHGDALHVGDLDPFRKGTEIWKCLENSPMYGTILYDGATGEILIHDVLGRDCGRCMAANISDDYKGAELWGSNYSFSASSLERIDAGGSVNYRIFWDGDLLDELLDHTNFSTASGYGTGSISKFGKGNIFVAKGAISNNYTKGTPSLQADLFGDWREEVVWRNEANTAIRIYTTTDPTSYRNYTLMHDHQYRQAVCWQMCGYNQPPHVSYFLGEAEGITSPPPPAISNKRLVYSGQGNWDKSAANWKSDGKDTLFTDGQHVLFDISAGSDLTVNISADVAPKVVSVNSEGAYTLEASEGKLSGEMLLVKQGVGTLTINGHHNFTGTTEVWAGNIIINGTLENSPIVLKHFAELNAAGQLGNGVSMRYGSILETGPADSSATLTIGNSLSMEEGSSLVFDLYSPTSSMNDSLIIDGAFTFDNKVVFNIKPHFNEGEEKLEAGDYLLAEINGEVNGDIETIVVEGISGTPSKLKLNDGKLYLEIKAVRAASTIEWKGDKTGSEWDLSLTENFVNNGTPDIFVDQDAVVFNDNALSKSVNINSEVTPSSILVNASENYTFTGNGTIAGNATLTKTGSGVLYIANNNDFTGKVLLQEGTLLLQKLPNAQETGAIGPMSNNPDLFEIDGATLAVTGENKTDRALKIGTHGATLRNTQNLQWNERITGGVLTKTGAGNLVLAGNNTHSLTILKEGSISLLNDNTNPGKTISLEGGTLRCNDNSGSYSTLSWNIDVPEGKTADIWMDSRGYYTGKLTGAGTLNMHIPFVRTDLNGDMSQFEGTLNCSATGSSADLRINNSNGLPNALLIVNSNLYTYNDKGTTLILGALAGNGSLTGSENYRIGSKDIDSEFNGTINAGSLTKVGSGTFTLTNNNTYTGGTIINHGVLKVENTSGSATGNGNVSVKSGAKLSGEGIIGGNVSVDFLGTLAPGSASTGRFMTINKILKFNNGSKLEVKANPLFNYIDYVVAGSVQLGGKLEIINSTTREFAEGNEFTLFKSENISGSFDVISPETPGEGLVWDLSELESKGLIKVAKATSALSIKQSSVKMYPNPVSDVLIIENKEANNVELIISDLSGKTLTSRQLSGNKPHYIDVSAFHAGIYFVEIKTDNTIYKHKIIKQ